MCVTNGARSGYKRAQATSTATRPSRTRTGYDGMRVSGSSRHWPVRRSKLCLKIGEAIFGTPAAVADDAARDDEGLAERVEVADGVDLVAVADADDRDLLAADQRGHAGVGGDVVERADVDPRRRAPRVRQEWRASAAMARCLHPPDPTSGERRDAPCPLFPRRGAVLRALRHEHDAGIGRVAVHERAELAQLLGVCERRLPLALVGVDDVRPSRPRARRRCRARRR